VGTSTKASDTTTSVRLSAPNTGIKKLPIEIKLNSHASVLPVGSQERSGRNSCMAESPKRAHNPKVAGSNPAPATKKTLGIPTCAEGFLASGIVENTHVKPVSNTESILTRRRSTIQIRPVYAAHNGSYGLANGRPWTAHIAGCGRLALLVESRCGSPLGDRLRLRSLPPSKRMS